MPTRKLDIPFVMDLQRALRKELIETTLLGISWDHIHISAEEMENVAPLKDWKLNISRQSEEYPYQHEYVYSVETGRGENKKVESVKFLAISKEPILIPEETNATDNRD